MKRYITIFAVFALCCLRCNAQTKVSVHAGDTPLETLLTDEQKNSVTHLTITGKLQEDDYAFINNTLFRSLVELNLKDAETDTIPQNAFIYKFRKEKSIRIILPKALTVISDFAFDSNRYKVFFVEITGNFPYLGLGLDWYHGITDLRPSKDNCYCSFCEECEGIYSFDRKKLFYSPQQNIHEGTKIISSRTFANAVFYNFTIPQSVDSIGDYAFQNATVKYPTCWDCPDPTVSCEAVIPPKLGKGVFDGSELPSFYVPDESVELYKNAEGWKDLYIMPISLSDIRTLSQAKAMSVKFENGHCILKHDSKTISHIAVYNTGGQILWTKDAEANEVRIPKQVLTSPFSLLNIHYSDGTAETIKIKP